MATAQHSKDVSDQTFGGWSSGNTKQQMANKAEPMPRDNELVNHDRINIPPRLSFLKRLGKNYIRQLKFPAMTLNGGEYAKQMLAPGQHLEVGGHKLLISKTQRPEIPDGFDDVLCASGVNGFEWSKRYELADPKWQLVIERRQSAAASLNGKFKFIEEERNGDLTVKTPGLRPPQIGAIHMALGHWKMSSDVATIVMPTGTGKTDSMVALLALEQPKCLLVVVPTDALRTQLAEKFLTLGVLVEFGLLPAEINYPVVGVFKSGFENATEITTFCDACNVIVTTMPLLGTFSELDQKTLASCCSHLFIDEAHHVRAATWNRLRSRFAGKPILQFTATPYRNDGQHVDGKIIFNYPLRKAQEKGYFKKIVLKELWDYVEPDHSVAEAAVERLKADLAAGLDHIVMARAANIAKAEYLKTIYQNLAPEFSPVVVHSDLKQKDLSARMEQLSIRKSRIAICVAMFGEGFDFPELKIAALHDIHQSLAVTIQFTGRFTRGNAKVGDATIIVNRAVVDVNDSVRELYAQGEGADWNHVLTKLTEGATENQINKENFYQSFGSEGPAVPIQNVTPKMSTVVYRTHLAKWTPWKITDAPVASDILGEPSISLTENTAYFVTLVNDPVEWADTTDLTNQTYDLYALFWDSETKLLYINSSNNASVHEELAKAVAGDDAELISGAEAFRALHGIKRLLLRNGGLNDRLRRSVRFMMFTGADIQAYLDASQLHGKEKTHVFGDGFDGTSRVTIGTSKKGRIWSWKEAKDLLEWKKWCVGIGTKLIDSTIDPDSFLQDSMVPEDIATPPALYPLAIEWPDELYQRTEESIFIDHGTAKVPFFDVGIDLINPAPGEQIKFKVFTEDFSASYRLRFVENKVVYMPDAEDLLIRIGRKPFKLSEFFAIAHPIIRYEKDCFSRADQLLKPRQRKLHTFNAQKIRSWKWDGVDLTKESQTIKKWGDSIQRRTIETVLSAEWNGDYALVFDDDAPGEAADVVCLAVSGAKLLVDLFHCKYTKGAVGTRIKDLYEVCGQAQRSIKWREDVDRFLLHLINREKDRMKKTGVSRFERGDFKHLQEIRNQARSLMPEFRIFIVQPGLSKAGLSDDQRELLGSTELYLYETFGIEFGVIASE
jgi:superfamily II DNA or RNA helicase